MNNPERLAQNEALARHLNEAVREESEANGFDSRPFVCECARASCVDAVEISLDDYTRVRSHPRHFVLAPGHESPGVESVIETQPGYIVVEKRGEAGRFAESGA
jgi:hypothetical protein